MAFIDDIKQRAKQDIKTIILPEAQDIRILKATEKVIKEGYAKIILLGKKEEIEKMAKENNVNIEGAEIKALMGSQNHIKIEKPKLLISVYHNYEDLWKIPRLIDNLNPNYKFFLRCYGTEIFPTEIILYAIN